MLTIKQRIRLHWFKLTNWQINESVMQNIFDNYGEEPELFYEINKHIASLVSFQLAFSDYILAEYAQNYNRYPALQNSINSIIKDYVENTKPNNYWLYKCISCILTQRCKSLAMFLIDIIRNNDDGIEKLNSLISQKYYIVNDDDTFIYKYLVECGADYTLIPRYGIYEKIKQEQCVGCVCLLVKILRNIPSELTDIKKLTNDIGQFMQANRLEYKVSKTITYEVPNLIEWRNNIYIDCNDKIQYITHIQNSAIKFAR